jgi:acetylornithine deacetylase/succinyl-diaminopimelate desuccinylase-like protein
MKKLLILVFACGLFFADTLSAENRVESRVESRVDAALIAANTWRQANEQLILTRFLDLLSIPNYGGNIPDIRANAALIMEMMERRGIATELLELYGTPPAIYGQRMVANAKKTILIYVHYDGQPTNDANWSSPPFSPTIRSEKIENGGAILDRSVIAGEIDPNWRIYARSASDDKAPIIAILAALDALDEAGIELSVNLKFFFEAEEELGSPNLEQVIEKYKDKLSADYALFFDGPQDQRGNARVVLGVRGVMGGQVKIYGPNTGLHSGHFGNFSPNPISRLAHLLASMRDDNGKVLIDGFYDEVEPPSASAKAMISAIPNGDAAISASIGVAAGGREFSELRYEETHLWPALNFQGIAGGGVGDNSRNVIIPSAAVSIGVRMVPSMTISGVEQLIDAHIRKQGYHIVRVEPDIETRLKYPKIAKVNWDTSGYEAMQTSPDEPITARLIEIVQRVNSGEALIYPTLGGSLPLSIMTKGLNMPLAVVPIVNQDNNQHSYDENIRIGHLWSGIELYSAIFVGLGE